MAHQVSTYNSIHRQQEIGKMCAVANWQPSSLFAILYFLIHKTQFRKSKLLEIQLFYINRYALNLAYLHIITMWNIWHLLGLLLLLLARHLSVCILIDVHMSNGIRWDPMMVLTLKMDERIKPPVTTMHICILSATMPM